MGLLFAALLGQLGTALLGLVLTAPALPWLLPQATQGQILW